MKTKTHNNQVYVDAGLIWIGDPCYIMGNDASHRVTRWSEFCEQLENHDKISTPLGEGVGVLVDSGYGDGCYEVETTTIDDPAWGTRVSSVTITFIRKEDDNE